MTVTKSSPNATLLKPISNANCTAFQQARASNSATNWESGISIDKAPITSPLLSLKKKTFSTMFGSM